MHLKLDSANPLYLQLTEYLQRQITAGVYAPGAKLPSERELAETYDVSRMTARQALQQVVQSGLAFSKVGKGTYVSQPKIDHELRELTSFSEEMQRRGATASSLVLQSVKKQADEETARLMRIIQGDPLFVLQRIRLSNNTPIALETAFLNPTYCPNLFSNHDFSADSLYRVLREDYGLHLVWANQSIEARLPDDYEQAHLSIKSHEPVLSLTRITFSETDIPLELVRSVYIGKHYQLRTTLRMGVSNE